MSFGPLAVETTKWLHLLLMPYFNIYEVRRLSQAFSNYRPNVFTFTLSLSKGQAGTAWEPLHEDPPPPQKWRVSHFPHNFLFCFYSSMMLPNSILGFKPLI
jgi:hypothetical protein